MFTRIDDTTLAIRIQIYGPPLLLVARAPYRLRPAGGWLRRLMYQDGLPNGYDRSGCDRFGVAGHCDVEFGGRNRPVVGERHQGRRDRGCGGRVRVEYC